MAKKPKGKLAGQFSASGGSGYYGFMAMMRNAKSWVRVGRETGLNQYYRQPKRTKDGGWILNIWEKKK